MNTLNNEKHSKFLVLLCETKKTETLRTSPSKASFLFDITFTRNNCSRIQICMQTRILWAKLITVNLPAAFLRPKSIWKWFNCLQRMTDAILLYSSSSHYFSHIQSRWKDDEKKKLFRRVTTIEKIVLNLNIVFTEGIRLLILN